MLFNSNAFYVFLPIAFALYWLAPRRIRWGVLLVCSYYFYMSANPSYALLLGAATLVTYGTGLLLERCPGKAAKRAVLGIALAVCLGILFFYKYFNFFSASVTALLRSFALPVSEMTLQLTLPVGISFYIFQSLGYVIDVYKGEQRACRHLGHYAAFISFFPLLLAGPIERAKKLLPQIEEPKTFDERNAIEGAKWIAWGYFKKLAIADVVGSYVDTVFDSVHSYSGLILAAVILLYTFQVYCDFSGYSDIARGVAKLLNIDLTVNFRSPYTAASVKEFWNRWHISLSTWFRDYVYFPLGGSRRGKLRTCRNILITFLVSGLWHGADWTYVIWGGLHGCWQILERLLRGNRRTEEKKGLRRLAGVIVTFLFVSFAWLFFRADTLADAGYIAAHLFAGITTPLAYLRQFAEALSATGMLASTDLKLSLLWIVLLMVFDAADRRRSVWERIGAWKKPVRYAVYFALVFFVLYSRSLGQYEFVYFQF